MIIWAHTTGGDACALHNGVSWRIRRINGFNPGKGPWFWLYCDGSRVNTDGSYETAVSFLSMREAKTYAAELIMDNHRQIDRRVR